MLESLMSQGVPALVASLITGALTALLSYRMSMRKQTDSTDARIREELRSLLLEERGAHSACLEEVKGMRADLTEARVSAARLETKCELLERLMTGVHERLITGYLGTSSKND